MDTDLRFSVLGPLQAWRGDELVQLGPPKQRQVLARLLLADGVPVPRESLIAALWPEGAPTSAPRAVHGYVGKLRKLLEPERSSQESSTVLTSTDLGYGLTAPSDLALVRALVAEARDARRAGDPELERRLLNEALGLRQGALLEDLPELLTWPGLELLDAELAGTFDHIASRLRELDAATLLGRDVDLRSLSELLPVSGAVTLTGPGGVGKTALASELAAVLAPIYPDGVFVADLGHLPEDATLDTAADLVRTAMGIDRERDGALPAVLNAVRKRRMLLVLDNVDHLTAGARHTLEEIVRIARLIQGVAERAQDHDEAGEGAVHQDHGTHVVVTSRVPLGTVGEHVWPVEPLATAPAVELLHGRPNVVESPVMAELVDSLGGLPLAIELAGEFIKRADAKRVRDHLVRREDLHEAFGLPWPTLDWVLDLLPDRERLLLCRMTVFPGEASAEAVADVCGHPPLVAEEIPELFGKLAEGKLIEPDGAVRPGLRDLAAARSDVPWTMRDRLLVYCLVGAVSGRKPSAADALAALSWALRAESGPTAVQAGAELIDAGWRVFTDGNAGAEPVLTWALKALEHPAGLPPHLCGLLNLRAGRLQMRLGRPGKARPHFERALSLFDLGAEGLRRRAEVMRHLVALDLTAVHPSIVALIAGAAAEARASGDPRALTGTLPFLALANAWLGRIDDALELVREAEGAGTLTHPEHAAFVYLRAGRPSECLSRTASLTARGGLVGAQALLARGWALMIKGDLPAASTALKHGEETVRRSGSLAVLPDFHEAKAHAARLSGDHKEAWSLSLRALRRSVEQQDVLTGMRAAYLVLALARHAHPQAGEIARLVRECRLRTGLPAWPFGDQEVAEWEALLGATAMPPQGWYPEAALNLLTELLAVSGA